MGLVSENWISDLWNGSRETWDRGDQATLFPGGSYRSFWYETGKGEIAAIGIHGQWIWIDPASATTIILQSAQDEPVSRPLEFAAMGMFRSIIKALG
jgi:CubicO group peptidase (beta-lactamase class C family)